MENQASSVEEASEVSADPINVLQLSWDDVIATYGGIQTQVNVLATRNPNAGNTRIAILPTLHPGQVKTPPSARHLRLQSLDTDLARLIDTHHIHVIHSHNIHRTEGIGIAPHVVGVLKEHRIPHVATIHDVLLNDSFSELARQRELLSETTRVATSDYVNDCLKTAFKLSATVINPALPEITDCNITKSSTIYSVAIPGRLVSDKGILEAIIICGHVSRDLGRMRLLLSSTQHPHNGAHPLFLEEINRLASCFPNLTLEFFKGLQAYPNLYQSVDLTVCLPSIKEGFGLLPLESIASGTPALVLTDGGLRWVEGYSQAVISVNRDYVGVARLIKEILINRVQWRSQVRPEQVRAQSDFSARKMLQLYQRLYERSVNCYLS